MPHIRSSLPAAALGGRAFADSLVLTYAQRRDGGPAATLGGVSLAVPAAAPAPAHGDAYELDDGRLVEIVAEAEPLLELRCADAPAMLRLAWELGGRHLDMEIGGRWLRVRRGEGLAQTLRSLGAKVTEIDGPFQPDRAADAAHHHGHAHHRHDDHGHHDHGRHEH